MKQWIKRIGAVLLTLSMLATMIPAVFAANILSTSVTGLTASWEYTSHANQSGNTTWSSVNTTISCSSKGGAAKTNISVLTLTNNSGNEAVLSFAWSQSTTGLKPNTVASHYISLTGALNVSEQLSSSGEFSQTLSAGESITITVKSPRGATLTSSFTITDLALVALSVPDPILTFKPATEGGSYTLDGVAVTAEVEKEVALQTVLQLSATANEGYNFYGWYDAINEKYLSYDAAFRLVASANAEIYPVFLSDSVALFGVGTAKFDNLTDAVNAAAKNDTDKTVVLLNDGTITGDYVIPAGVTLLIPYNDANTAHGSVPACTSKDNNEVKWVQPYAYRTLTMAADASITVNGALEVGGRHSAAAAGRPAAPTDALGYIYMTAGSHIEVNGDLYAWGYIYGDGTVTANNGAGIYEVFQITDLRGGNATLALASDLMVFPMTQYYVQNVEVATTYNYGATAYVTSSFFLASQCITAPPIKFIGEDAMFQTGKNCHIVKKYDPATDTLNLDAYGDCALSTIVVSLAGNVVDSSNFVLPISNNINISIWSGTATLKQDIVMLPGSSLTVGPEATLEIGVAETPTATMSAGHNLILFDSENWTSGLNLITLEYEENLTFVYPGKQFVSAPYSPSERKERTLADIKDVVFDINGVVVANGYIYSTVTWKDIQNEDLTIVSGGAEIVSSEGTGILCLNSGAGIDMLLYQYDQNKDAAYKEACKNNPDFDPENDPLTLYHTIPLASVQLKNGNGSLLDTTGAEAGAYYTYCTSHDHWIAGDECKMVEITWVVNGESITFEVPYGTVPTCPVAPEKALDNNHHYIFAGWATSEGGAVIDLPTANAAATYYAVFSAKAHAYSATATSGKHYCVCGKPASCADAENDGDHLCDLGCGTTKTEHLGGTATCDKLAVCTECGQGYGSLKAHTPGAAANCENAQTCTVCGTVLNTALGHDYKAVVTAPDCVNGGYTTHTCSRCGDSYKDSYTNAKGHTPGAAADCDSAQTCTVCGEVLNVALGHSYKAVVTAPDCVNGGYTTHTCSRCGDSYKDSYTNAKGHTPGAAADCVNDQVCTVCGTVLKAASGHEYVVTVIKPDCENQGYTEHYCVLCEGHCENGFYKDNFTDALGHTYDDEYDADCNVCGDIREVPEKPVEPPVGDILYGDANGDGKVNNMDVAQLQKYTAGWDVALNMAAADVNGDGNVNNFDLAQLQKYAAGWDIVLGPKN